ncbi:MAG: hypothetical protein D6681_12040 [Calditrichaeota bacterium]|nr:MAG: hypothetical protein D6681_12040 [Calditrichota bacterium]
MKRGIILLLVGLGVLLLWCEKEESPSPEVVAEVNGKAITLPEFRRFYELDPNFGLDSTGYPALLDELHKLIDHYLAYEEARRTGLLRDSLFIRAQRWEHLQATLRQLYREEVDRRVQISEAELREAFVQENVQLHVRHLFVKDAGKAQELYRRLQAGETFEALAAEVFQDTLLSRNGGDLGWVTAGELDEDFADAALKLRRGEISPPVQTRWGYHIIQVLDRKAQVMLTEAAFNARRSALEKRVRRAKRAVLAHRYIAEFMGTLNPQPDPHTFRRLWEAIVPPAHREQAHLPFPIMFTNELIDRVRRALPGALEQPLIHYRNGQVTLGEYLRALKEVPLSHRPRFRTPRELSNKIGIWIRDQLLYEEARRKGLHRHPRVLKEVEEFLRQQCYLYLLQRELQTITVPDSVQQYFRTRDDNILKRLPLLRHFHTPEEWRWYQAERRLHRALRSHPASINIHRPLLRRESQSIDWQRRIRLFAIRKPS